MFAGPESGVTRVSFFIDDPQMNGLPTKVENLAPYDLGGTDNSLLALPFNSAQLADGAHSLTALLALSDGSSEVLAAGFSVANNAPEMVFSTPTVNVSVQEGDGPTFQAIDLDTSDGSAANYTITDDASWLSVLPTSGVTPGTVTATIDPTGVAAGIYMATITATAGSYIADTVVVTLTVTSAGSAYDLLLSDSPDRSGAALLDGATVSGSMYVFAGPESGVTRVSFFIDDPQMNGLPTKVENLAPYDLGGTDNSLLALPFNSAQLADGAHTLTALLALSDGSSEVLAAGFFTNNSISLPFTDDFEDGDASGWSITDGSGNVSNWVVNNGGYVQSNFVGRIGSALEGTYHLGTYAILQAGKGLSDYRFSVDVTPQVGAEVDQNIQGNDIGVMFRYLDDDNYYRFSINSNKGFSRLEKKSGGIFTTLAKDARGYHVGELRNIVIELVGPVINVFLDGDALFGAFDQDIINGSVGLYCQDRTTFDNVLISDAGSIPSIVIATPTAYSVSTSENISVAAVITRSSSKPQP